MSSSLRFRAAIVSVAIFLVFIGAWHLATRSTGSVAAMSPEYAKLMGLNATQGKSAMPGPLDVGAKLWEHIKRPFYDNGPNDKGLGIQLAYSIARVAIGYLLAVAVAIPLGFLIGMSPLLSKALDPFIQILKPISPLAWMPLALYTIKDSGLSAIFVLNLASWADALLRTETPDASGNELMVALESRGIGACYSAGPMYHLVFRSDERVILSPLQKNRIPAYDELVEAAESICYVFRDDQDQKRQHLLLLESLDEKGVRYERFSVGQYNVLSGFEPREVVDAEMIRRVRTLRSRSSAEDG